MTTVTVAENVNAPARAVWDALSDFGGLKVGGPITSFETEGDGVGMVRKIGMGGALVEERLDRHDADALIFTYSIVNEDAPLPVSGYSATVTITPEGDKACHVDWTGNFEPKGDEAAAVKVIEGIYTGGIARARKSLGI
jgi:hypothetical protein